MVNVPTIGLWGGGQAQPYFERQTGLTGTSLVLANTPIISVDDPLPTPFALFKNGLLLDPSPGADYTLAGNTVTLAVAAVNTDKFEAHYWYQVA